MRTSSRRCRRRAAAAMRRAPPSSSAAVLASVRAGDVVMVKGSNSIRMARIVKALKERYGEADGRAAAKG